MPAPMTSSRKSSPNAVPGVAEVKFSSTARRDLARIDDYSAEQFGGDVADTYARGFNEAFALLADVPFAGEARPDFGKDVRCKVHRSHRILYRVRGDTVFVERILHHSQDSRRHLSK